jgi:glutathione S-transferase
MVPLYEKGLAFQSIYVDLHKFEQQSDWFVAINPEGQVPVLDHDGYIVTHTSVVNEYLADVFGESPLRPGDPIGAARMRYWNTPARSTASVLDQRKKWMTARSGFSEADLANATERIIYAVEKVDRQLTQTPWLAGNDYTLADINFVSHCGMMVERMFPDLGIAQRCPRLVEWRERMAARPAVTRSLAGEDRTAPGLRTWTGHAR